MRPASSFLFIQLSNARVVGPGDFTTSGHFLVLTGVDDSGDIILRDPNSRIRTEKTWDIGELMAQIKNLWAYSY